MALRLIQVLHHGSLTSPAKSIFSPLSLNQNSRRRTQLLFAPRNQINRFHGRNTRTIERQFVGAGTSNNTNPSILKPVLFTVGISVSAFVGATIWEYEKVRARTIQALRKPFYSLRDSFARKQGDVISELKQAWDKATPGQKFFIPICAINLAVFTLWRIPSMKRIMTQYFLSNPVGKTICWPMFLSTFSHYSTFHILTNMYVMYSFSNLCCHSLGIEQTTAMYMSAGVFASLTSLLAKVARGSVGASLGASGAIMAMVGYICTRFPEAQISIMFLPMFTFSAGKAILTIMSVDLVGLVLGWKFLDHAAHLGGALFGIFWFYMGQSELWPKRRYIVEQWHKLRSNDKR